MAAKYRDRRAIARKAAAKSHRVINYYKIAQMEIEEFGETKPNVDSPIPAGRTNVYGIDKSGHYDEGGRKNLCNVNASLGPVCRNKFHTLPRGNPFRSAGEGTAAIIRAATGTTIHHDPYGYGYSTNPYADWTDEGGRPW